MFLDILVIAVLLISAGVAFFRGLIREALTILGIVGGLAAAYFGGPMLSPVVHGWFDTGTAEEPKKLLDIISYDLVADAIAYGAVFIVVVIVLSVASHFLSGWAKAIGLGAIDRTLGVIFGLVRGVIIIGLLYLPVSIVVEKETTDEWFKDSRTHFYVAATADTMMKFVPESFRAEAGEKAEEAADSMAQATREKLQELDVLGGGAGSGSQAPAAAQSGAPGYEQEQRQEMKELFEENSYEGGGKLND